MVYYVLCRLEYKGDDIALMLIPKGMDSDYAFSFRNRVVGGSETYEKTVDKFLVTCDEYDKFDRPIYPESLGSKDWDESNYERNDYHCVYF